MITFTDEDIKSAFDYAYNRLDQSNVLRPPAIKPVLFILDGAPTHPSHVRVFAGADVVVEWEMLRVNDNRICLGKRRYDGESGAPARVEYDNCGSTDELGEFMLRVMRSKILKQFSIDRDDRYGQSIVQELSPYVECLRRPTSGRDSEEWIAQMGRILELRAEQIVSARGDVHPQVIIALVFSTAIDDLRLSCVSSPNDAVIHFGRGPGIPYSEAVAALADHDPAREHLSRALKSVMSRITAALLSQRRFVDFDLTGQALPPKR